MICVHAQLCQYVWGSDSDRLCDGVCVFARLNVGGVNLRVGVLCVYVCINFGVRVGSSERSALTSSHLLIAFSITQFPRSAR